MRRSYAKADRVRYQARFLACYDKRPRVSSGVAKQTTVRKCSTAGLRFWRT